MNETIKTKVCTKCKVEQELSCFAKASTAKKGHRSNCKKCDKIYNDSKPKNIPTVYNLVYTKICTKCKTEKKSSCFYRDFQKSDGLNNSCKDCSKEYDKKAIGKIKGNWNIVSHKVCTVCKVEQESSCFSRCDSKPDRLSCSCKACKHKYYTERIAKLNNNRIEVSSKTCCRCKINKEHTQFYKRISSKDSLMDWCIDCEKKYMANKKNKIAGNWIIPSHKTCSKCKVNKIISHFSKSNSRKDRTSNCCKSCEKQYVSDNKEMIKAKRIIYSKTPIAIASRKNIKHNRRLKENQGDVTTEQLMELEQNAKVCYWCNCSLKKVKVHIDHYEPLSKGGKHTLSNLVVSCQHCNSTKFTKSPYAFAQSLGKLL